MAAQHADLKVVGRGVHPSDQEQCTFFVSWTALEKIETDSPWKFQDEWLLEQAVAAPVPSAAFSGLSRVNHEDGAYCISVAASALRNAPQEGVFLIYIKEEPGMGFAGPIIIDWDWRPEDKDHPGRPVGWQKDFGEPTWHRQA